jgi:hypothetical protein
MVVIASLAIAGLSACRSEPAVAAYVGDTEIPDARVQEIWTEARKGFDAELPKWIAAAEQAVADAKQKAATGEATEADVQAAQDQLAQIPRAIQIDAADVVSALIARKLYDQVAQRNKLTVPADFPYDKGAANVWLPPDTEYVHLYTENVIMKLVVAQSLAASAQLTDGDLADVYQRLEARKVLPPGSTFESFRNGLNPDVADDLKAGILARNELNEVAEPLHIKINPRYQPVEMVTSSVQMRSGPALDLVGAPLGVQPSSPVTDFS